MRPLLLFVLASATVLAAVATVGNAEIIKESYYTGSTTCGGTNVSVANSVSGRCTFQKNEYSGDAWYQILTCNTVGGGNITGRIFTDAACAASAEVVNFTRVHGECGTADIVNSKKYECMEGSAGALLSGVIVAVVLVLSVMF